MPRTRTEQPKQRTRDSAPDDTVRTVSFVSLGCPKNLVDSEKMLGMLAGDGLAVVSHEAEVVSEEPGAGPRGPAMGAAEGEVIPGSVNTTKGGFGADAVVINTCGFLEASKDESLSVIKDAIREKEAGRVKRVVVAGCLVQRHRAKMLEWAPGIDAMVGVFDRDKIIEAVRGTKPERESLGTAGDAPKYWVSGNALVAAKERGLKTTGLTVQGKDGKGIGYFEDDSARLRLTPRHYAYLRVSEGCNQNCAFCTIPSIRGKMRSKPIERIVAEAKELIADGAFELNLIGQDTTSFGEDIGSERLPNMLKAVSDAFDEARADGWVRLMYAYPSNFTDAMIDAIAKMSTMAGGKGKGRVLPYIDIPLQHASDRMLALMKRNVKASQQRELMHKLRDRIGGMAIRTTFISGFPGETEDDHKQLLEFVEEIGFDAVGVFEYSREEGTPAGTMELDPALEVPREVKARRRAEIMELQQRIAFEQNEFLAGRFDEKKPRETGARFDILIDRAAAAKGTKTTGVGAGGRLYVGRAYFQAPQIDSVMYVQSRRELSPGEVVRCAVVGWDNYDLVAKPTEDLEKKVGLRVIR